MARLAFGGTEGAIAYQAIVGLALPIQAVPGLALTAEYRFLLAAPPATTSTAAPISTRPWVAAPIVRVSRSPSTPTTSTTRSCSRALQLRPHRRPGGRPGSGTAAGAHLPGVSSTGTAPT